MALSIGSAYKKILIVPKIASSPWETFLDNRYLYTVRKISLRNDLLEVEYVFIPGRWLPVLNF